MSCDVQPARHNHQPTHQPTHQQGTKWTGKAKNIFAHIKIFTGKSSDMEFVQKFTPLYFQVKNFTPSILPNFNSFSKRKHKRWVKMEKLPPLANILHCRRHWRDGQIPPLEIVWNGKKIGQIAFLAPCHQGGPNIQMSNFALSTWDEHRCTLV